MSCRLSCWSEPAGTTAKCLVVVPLLLFVWAMLRTGELGRMGNRNRISSQASSRQIEVVVEMPKYRLIRHVAGETRIPRNPRRIVGLSAAATDGLASLGIRPVLVESAWKSSGPAPYLAKPLNGVPFVRRSGTPMNIEAILDSKPDLILAGTEDVTLVRQLNKIAPTILRLAGRSNNRETSILDIADVVGMRELAERRLTEYRQRLNQARNILATTAARQTVAFLRFRRTTCVIYARTTPMFGSLLFDELRLAPDPAMPVAALPGGWDVLSIERLSMLQATHVFIVVDPDSESYFNSIAQMPMWRRLPAVKNGHIHRVAHNLWLRGEGILANEAIITDVLTAFASP